MAFDEVQKGTEAKAAYQRWPGNLKAGNYQCADLSYVPSYVLSNGNSTTFTGDDPAELVKRDGTKYVFMHHVRLSFPYTQADWADDIRQIQAKGIDAIALNIGSSDWQRGQIASAYAAAVGSPLKLFISFDFTEMPCDVADVVSRTNQWVNHPNQFKVNGKTMISSFSGDCFGNNGWQAIKDQTNGYLMPFIPNLEGKFSSWPSLDSWLCWGCAWPQGDYTKNTDDDNYYISQLGTRYSATISPWFYTHYNYKNIVYNSDNWLLVTRWEQLMSFRNTITFAELVSWNDYGESHHMGPVKGAMPSGTNWVNGLPHTAWFDMSQYYITAFQTGSYPAITKDVIYFWARTHPVAATASSDSLGKPSGWNWVQDTLWAVVFATSPGSVTLTSGTNTQTFSVNAGVNKLKLPLSPGKITVSMTKNGQVIINYSPAGYTFITNPVTCAFVLYTSSSAISTSTRPSSSAASTSSASPTPSFAYAGCYVDSSNARILNGGSTTSSTLSVNSCISSCSARGFVYAGTEYGKECWCGSVLASGAARAAESDCKMTCSGQASDICGGSNRMSLYRLSSGTSSSSPAPSSSAAASSTSRASTSSTSSTATSASSTTSATWTYVGCVAEGTTGSRRALTGPSYTRADMTPALCQSLCTGYDYSGTENGSQGFCGNSLTNNGATGATISSTSCNTSCSGDSTQKCGGSWTLSLFTRRTTTQPRRRHGASWRRKIFNQTN
ncbi:glycoside hydrolase family 71 protein [Pleurotus ostreatus PC15]|uniref:Glycoside hydrolase family 71 protein n=1 Tax=Pleurotus ostreatus (strain PC15) TaxID=1137138 RepID=A0A067NYP8_PLEO1|nr:glycoside hydrolase family 71 protein [Pleurotus ostreatus PC15]